jgi:hypothetical protein
VVDQAWPGWVFRPVAQPQRHLEGVQHQLGALVSGGGLADDGLYAAILLVYATRIDMSIPRLRHQHVPSL